MIKKTKEGYVVVSKDGKFLSRMDLTYTEAARRLKEIDFYRQKHK